MEVREQIRLCRLQVKKQKASDWLFAPGDVEIAKDVQFRGIIMAKGKLQ